MAFYGDVTPGEEFRPSAALSNDIRHFLNSLNGFGGNPFGANGAGTVRIQAYNATGGEIRAGTAVNFDESKKMLLEDPVFDVDKFNEKKKRAKKKNI